MYADQCAPPFDGEPVTHGLRTGRYEFQCEKRVNNAEIKVRRHRGAGEVA